MELRLPWETWVDVVITPTEIIKGNYNPMLAWRGEFMGVAIQGTVDCSNRYGDWDDWDQIRTKLERTVAQTVKQIVNKTNINNALGKPLSLKIRVK